MVADDDVNDEDDADGDDAGGADGEAVLPFYIYQFPIVRFIGCYW